MFSAAPTHRALSLAGLSIVLAGTVLACGGGEESEAPTVDAAPDPHDAGVDTGPLPDAGPPRRIFAKRFVVKVHARPDRESSRLGYLRAGAVLQATTALPIGTEGCSEGWFELTTGGYVCNGRDVVAFDGRRLPSRPPTQPDYDEPLPYRYARTRRDGVPMYSRLPTDEDAALYEGYRIPGLEPPPIEGDPTATASADAPTPTPTPPPIVETEIMPASGAAATSAAEGEVIAAEEDLVPTLASLQGERGGVLRRRLVSGFIVSLDRDVRAGPRRYWRSLSNGIIPYFSLGMVQGSAFHGEVLAPAALTAVPDPDAPPAPEGQVLDGERMALPIGFVTSSKTTLYSRGRDGRPRRGRRPGYHHVFRITSEEMVRDTAYVVASDAEMYRAEDVTILRAATERPPEVGESETWIDVDLGQQTLIAYEGLRPVFATLIASGRIRDPEDPLQTHDTPTGIWRIASKYVTHTMDGDHAVDGPYSIEDVPYVMYFFLAFALHSAFWHDGFGRPRSHGCVNMSPSDARWLFGWAHPHLPVGWHSVFPSEAEPGTWVYVHGVTPEG
jgi:lipoprotein-anchoring transpeptidase ErfK/SrfK